MRNPSRIEPFLMTIEELTTTHFPKMPFSRVMLKFLIDTGDPFYLEEPAFIERFTNWVGSNPFTEDELKDLATENMPSKEFFQVFGQIWWEMASDWRFGQLISNLLAFIDISAMSDNEFLVSMRGIFNKV